MRRGAPDSLLGRTIAGKFAIEALIGAGAMGAVYRARQITLDKTVAIKVLHVEHAGDSTFTTRFHREAKAASRLSHPNSMQVIDFGEDADGLLYIAMEYLDGRNLLNVIREDWPLAPARVADILMQTLAALAVAHEMGVVHRDLKPENIMVLPGISDDGAPTDLVKVCDFGIAKITEPRSYKSLNDAPATTKGFLVGTPEYMSPEQGKGDKLDARSDLYSCGVILYQMLTGRVPFQAENAIGVVLKHITEAPIPPSEVAPGVDPGLEAACLHALAKDREGRPATARQMRSELRAAVQGSPSAGQEIPIPLRSHKNLPPSSVPEIAHAATEVALSSGQIRLETETGSSGAGDGKPSQGTRRRVFAVAGLAVAVGAAGAILGAALLKGRRPEATAATGALTASPTAVIVPDVPPDPASPPSAAPRATGPRPKAPVTPSAVRSAPSVSASHAAPPPAPSPAPSSTSSVSAPASVAPPDAPPLSAPDAAPTPPAGPPYDPSRAFVAIGMINAMRVKETVLRQVLRGAGFAGCYRSALKARGTAAAGNATLSLSIDENGRVRSAILMGADFLPGMRACVQQAAYVVVPSSAVEGNASAEVVLQFSAP